MLDSRQVLLSFALALGACRSQPDAPEHATQTQVQSHAEFRTGVIEFVREVSEAGPALSCPLPAIPAPLHVVVSIYDQGERSGRAISTREQLCPALTEASLRALAEAGLERDRVAQARFVVEFSNRGYALVEHEGEGLELVGGLVPVRELDEPMLRRRIAEGTAYLLRVMDPQLGGVHKYYHAPTDSFEDRLHTIYTASTIYTLVRLQAQTNDEALREPILRAAGFLRSMQRVAPGAPGHGAFHYSLDRRRRIPEPRFVVGTTSKSIFSLIELHALTGDDEYLDAARLAGDWLLTMQGEDGRVAAELQLEPDGTWTTVERESLLYTGQVLSALSRLHEATATATATDTRYLDAAARTAAYLRARVERDGCYLGDDYRKTNPISSSWTILALFDFARASGDARNRELAYRCADELLDRQIDAPDDVLRHGRWSASLSSSGAGWMAEVLSELYLACPADDPDNCTRYRDAIVLLFRLLMQYTYSPENSFMLRNPDMARGGLFWNPLDRDVRTDSVCHAMNAYVSMLDQLPDGVLVELPEAPLEPRLQARAQ